MMKKLLTLMLVLVLASAANAGIIPGSFTLWVSHTGLAGSYVEGVDSEVTLSPSDNLWIGINNSVQGGMAPMSSQMGVVVIGIQIPSMIIGYDEETGDPIYGPSGPAGKTWTGLSQLYQPPLVATPAPPTPFGNSYLGVGGMGGSLILDSWMAILTDGNPASFNGVGVLDAKQLHVVDPLVLPDDVIYLLNGDTGEVYDTLIIHQIPEPMTIMLLGLGGLLLRRRNK